MDLHFAALPAGNATLICVGGITNFEAEIAREDGHEVDGFGHYLFLADRSDPKRPIKLLGKFFSASEAEAFARAVGWKADNQENMLTQIAN